MAMDFPAFPAVGQEYTVGTVTYVYNGTGWVVKGSSSDQFVVKSGDTMTGHLGLPSGPSASQAVRKDYVDAADAAIGTSIATGDALKVNKSGDMMTGDLEISKASGSRLRLVSDPLSANVIIGQRTVGGINKGRWALWLTDGGAETGSNAGSDFALARYDDAGNVIDFPFRLTRATGLVLVTPATASTSPTTGALTVAGGVGINGDLNVNGNINFKGVPAAPLDALAYNGMQVNGGCEVSQEFGTAPVPLVNTGVVTHISDMWQSVVAQASIVAEAQNVPVPFASQYVAAIPRCIQIKATTGGVISAAGDRIRFRNTIEGSRIAGLGFGTSDAKPVTVAFWVFTTVPGTMSLAVRSNNQSGGFRSCVKNIVINAGNTWEYKVVTFPADNAVSNAWSIDNMPGIALQFCFGAGSTWQTPTTDVYVNADVMATPSTSTNFLATANNVVSVTGLCVLPGTQAPTAAQSPLIMRPYDQELVLCKRYWHASNMHYQGLVGAATKIVNVYPVPMRATPTVTLAMTANNVPGYASLTNTEGTIHYNAAVFNGTSGSNAYFNGTYTADARY
jgi:hypothetical protein